MKQNENYFNEPIDGMIVVHAHDKEVEAFLKKTTQDIKQANLFRVEVCELNQVATKMQELQTHAKNIVFMYIGHGRNTSSEYTISSCSFPELSEQFAQNKKDTQLTL